MKAGKSRSVKLPYVAGFAINTPSFLREVFDFYPGSGGVLKVPANVLRLNLLAVAERASQLNGPVLNALMCNMALYAIADGYDKENYNPKLTAKLLRHPEYTNWIKTRKTA